jgi:hypothetical protein
MNNFSDEDDPQLTNFLRQHRSIAPGESSDVEARLMSKIEAIDITKDRDFNLRLWRRIVGGFGLVAAGSFGIMMHYLMNPLEPKLSEIDKLDSYLLAHSQSFVSEQESIDNSENLDAFLLQEEEPDNM